MLPALRHMADRQWATSDLIEALGDEFGVTPEERGKLLPSGRQAIFANRVHWALAHLIGSGLISRLSRGHDLATEAGRAVAASAPPAITRRFLQRTYPAYARFLQRTSLPTGEESAGSVEKQPLELIGTPEEQLDALDRGLKAKLTKTILERMRSMSPTAFEQLIIDLLVAIGFCRGASWQRCYQGSV
jgi:restriction system protein